MPLLNIDPQNSGAIHNLGIVYMNRNEYAKAEKAFRAVYELNPNNPTVCFMLGKVLSMNQNTLGEAVQFFQKGLNIMPNNLQAWADLAGIYMATGNKEQAISVLEMALKANPGAKDIKTQIEIMKRQN